MTTRFEPMVALLAQHLRAAGCKLVSAESCTGGLIAAACTALAGSSDWFERGFVTYSNDAKRESLGVDPALLEGSGAVSEPVARAMAEGALARSAAQLAVAVTGIAGPGGGVPGKPVGMVWLAWSHIGRPTQSVLLQLHGDRAEIRAQTVEHALQRLIDALAAAAG